MQRIGIRHRFFRPLSRRVVTCGLTGAWALFELAAGHSGWALMFGAVAALCVWEFLIVFDPENYRDEDGA